MINPASGQRRIVIRANRETLMLVVAASAATFALAFAVRSKPPEPPATAEVAQLHEDWTGHLAEVSDQTGTTATEPLTSASLVVPKAQLALPNVAVRPKPRGCDGTSSCGKGPIPVTRARAERTESARLEAERNRSLMSRLNPLNHIPDMATLGRPFAYAGETISGWMDRL